MFSSQYMYSHMYVQYGFYNVKCVREVFGKYCRVLRVCVSCAANQGVGVT